MSDEISIHIHRWAPAKQFRLLVWQREPGELYGTSWLEDFATFADARARAEELAGPTCRVCLCDEMGKTRLDLPRAVAKADFRRPTSVTKLAGLEAKAPSSNYSKKR